MSLASRLAKPEQDTWCKVGNLLISLPPDEHAALADALEDSAFTAREIVTALRAEGFDVGRTTVQEHRAKVCRCVG